MSSIEGALVEAVDLEEDGAVDEQMEDRVSLKEDVAAAREKPLRNVAHVK